MPSEKSSLPALESCEGRSLFCGITQVDSNSQQTFVPYAVTTAMLGSVLHLSFGLTPLHFFFLEILTNWFLTYKIWECPREAAQLKQMKMESGDSRGKVKINDA